MITPAKPGDLPAILNLLEECKLPPDGLAEHLETTLVARHRGGVMGCAALELYGHDALLRSVAVAAELRGQGLGQRLTRLVLELARQKGVSAVYLLTETASEFFPRFGFHPITRGEVPAAVQTSVEFTSACPASALAMRLFL